MGQSLTKAPVNPTLEDLGENLRYNDVNAFIYLNIGTDTKGDLNKISIVELKPKTGTNSAICTLIRLLKWLIRHKNTNQNTRVVFSGAFKKDGDWETYFKQFMRDNKNIDLGFSIYQGGMSTNLHTLIEKLELLCNGVIPIPKAPPMPIKKTNVTNTIKLKTGKSSEQKGILIEPTYSQVPPYKCQYNCEGQPKFDPHPVEQTFSLKPWTPKSSKKEEPVPAPPPPPPPPPPLNVSDIELDVMSPIQQRIQLNKKNVDERLQAKVKQLKIQEQERQAKKEINREQNRIAKIAKDAKRNANIERQNAKQKQGIDDYAKTAGFELFFGRKRRCNCPFARDIKYLMSL
jgi:hypothetical protein